MSREPSIEAACNLIDIVDDVGDRHVYGVASVVWGGDAKGTALHTEVNFGAPGDYSIQMSVTDDDNVTATAAMNVTVKETKNGGRPA